MQFMSAWSLVQFIVELGTVNGGARYSLWWS